jgi:hypothetical protein
MLASVVTFLALVCGAVAAIAAFRAARATDSRLST